MLSLQLFAYPIINTNRSPSIQKTFTSLPKCTTQNRTNGLNICNNFSTNPSRFMRFRLAASSSASYRGSGFGAIELPRGLEPELMPNHVAVIMDGNRRWATNKSLKPELGHVAGVEAIKRVAILCSQLGVKVLTVFAFSTENWMRPNKEVDYLMSLFEEVLKSEFDVLMRHNMQISVIGDKSRWPKSLQSLLSSTEESAKTNNGMRLALALNYGGRYDITEASKEIERKVSDGVLRVEDVDEAIFEQHLVTGGVEFPNPDLLIRTSGEMRISNFMLWQLAYSELWFLSKLFPDFEEADLIEALQEFRRRQRRYGG